MSNSRRSPLLAAYVLGSRPLRDTSRILEVLTRDQGRLGVFARAVRGSASKLAPLLQPFRPLLMSLNASGESQWLAACEPDGFVAELPPAALMSGFYLNELLIKLTARHDPHPGLFDSYHDTLSQLRAGVAPHRPLRLFELQLLQEIGYGLMLEQDAQGRVVSPTGYYCFRPGEGLLPADAAAPGALPGTAVLSLAAGTLDREDDLHAARRLLAAALDQALEGRPITTRAVARACQVARPSPAGMTSSPAGAASSGGTVGLAGTFSSKDNA